MINDRCLLQVDHFLAIIRPLHYPHLMSRKRCTMFILLLWTISFLTGFSDFIMSFRKYSRRLQRKYTYCEFVYMTKFQEEYTVFVIAGICLFIMTVTYTSMMCTIQKRPDIAGGPLRNEHRRNKKALFTTLFILGTFMVCWGPNCLFQVTLIALLKYKPNQVMPYTSILSKIDPYLFDLLLLNCIIDPIVYIIRLREIKQGWRNLFSLQSYCCHEVNSPLHSYRFSAYSMRSTLIMEERRNTMDRSNETLVRPRPRPAAYL